MHFLKDRATAPCRGADVTPPQVYAQRRTLLSTLAAGGAGARVGVLGGARCRGADRRARQAARAAWRPRAP